jgi:hypothetical protein
MPQPAITRLGHVFFAAANGDFTDGYDESLG